MKIDQLNTNLSIWFPTFERYGKLLEKHPVISGIIVFAFMLIAGITGGLMIAWNGPYILHLTTTWLCGAFLITEWHSSYKVMERKDANAMAALLHIYLIAWLMTIYGPGKVSLIFLTPIFIGYLCFSTSTLFRNLFTKAEIIGIVTILIGSLVARPTHHQWYIMAWVIITYLIAKIVHRFGHSHGCPPEACPTA